MSLMAADYSNSEAVSVFLVQSQQPVEKYLYVRV
jgi:hypothetical protein